MQAAVAKITRSDAAWGGAEAVNGQGKAPSDGGQPRGLAVRPPSAVRVAQLPYKNAAITAAEQPRLAVNIASDREATAMTFLNAAQRALARSTPSITAPEAFAAAALEAVSLSDAHNQHCRAGIPIDDTVQSARRELDGAMAALLATKDGDIPSRNKLVVARQRLASLGADPNKNFPVGLRGLIYGEVSRWLAPHELQALAAASDVPHMLQEDLERPQLVSAKTSLKSVKDALVAAFNARQGAPGNPEAEARYQQCLKHAYVAMELVFNDAMKAVGVAERDCKAVQADLSPQGLVQRQEFRRVLTEKKAMLSGVAEDLKEVANLRLGSLTAFCKGIKPRDGRPSARFDEASEQLAQVKALRAACVYVTM